MLGYLCNMFPLALGVSWVFLWRYDCCHLGNLVKTSCHCGYKMLYKEGPWSILVDRGGREGRSVKV